MQDHLKNLEEYMKFRGFSEKTIKSYKYNVSQFLRFVGKDPENVLKNDIETYLMHLVE